MFKLIERNKILASKGFIGLIVINNSINPKCCCYHLTSPNLSTVLPMHNQIGNLKSENNRIDEFLLTQIFIHNLREEPASACSREDELNHIYNLPFPRDRTLLFCTELFWDTQRKEDLDGFSWRGRRQVFWG